ncbi:hypothetical protein RI129_004015 [Pyrocoelia pectoralis]|uniref:lysozyme n=1 Tax=Pyrocoelia pectoralis TaxID=417401 RepID=A0AAN7VTJ8_9COLE
MKCLLFLLLSAFCLLTEGKIFTKCGLVEELNLRNFPRSFIGQWVCMIESESGKDTSKVYEKANGSKNLGLFQINDRGWCEYGKAGGKCAMKCEGNGNWPFFFK